MTKLTRVTKQTRVMLEQYEVRISGLKENYSILREDLAKLDRKSICYETNAINILMRMKEIRDEYRTLENVILSIKAANEEFV